MNQVWEIAVTGRVLYTEWRKLTYAAQPERWAYGAQVVLVKYNVDKSVVTGRVPEPCVLSLLLVAIADPGLEPVMDSTLLLDEACDDNHAIRTAISRFDELLAGASELIDEWRSKQGFV